MSDDTSTACSVRVVPGEVIGKACSNCGHTNVVHPGVHNPHLTACVICRMNSTIVTVMRRKA